MKQHQNKAYLKKTSGCW